MIFAQTTIQPDPAWVPYTQQGKNKPVVPEAGFYGLILVGFSVILLFIARRPKN